jgi:hypothetical protein
MQQRSDDLTLYAQGVANQLSKEMLKKRAGSGAALRLVSHKILEKFQADFTAGRARRIVETGTSRCLM